MDVASKIPLTLFTMNSCDKCLYQPLPNTGGGDRGWQAVPIYMTYFLGARSIVADTVPYQSRARTMGMLSSFSLLGSGFGSILVGELLLYFEYQIVFKIGASIAFIALIVGWRKF